MIEKSLRYFLQVQLISNVMMKFINISALISFAKYKLNEKRLLAPNSLLTEYLVRVEKSVSRTIYYRYRCPEHWEDSILVVFALLLGLEG